MAEFFASKDWQTFLDVLPSIPAETWDTFYSTVVATHRPAAWCAAGNG